MIDYCSACGRRAAPDKRCPCQLTLRQSLDTGPKQLEGVKQLISQNITLLVIGGMCLTATSLTYAARQWWLEGPIRLNSLSHTEIEAKAIAQEYLGTHGELFAPLQASSSVIGTITQGASAALIVIGGGTNRSFEKEN